MWPFIFDIINFKSIFAYPFGPDMLPDPLRYSRTLCSTQHQVQVNFSILKLDYSTSQNNQLKFQKQLTEQVKVHIPRHSQLHHTSVLELISSEISNICCLQEKYCKRSTQWGETVLIACLIILTSAMCNFINLYLLHVNTCLHICCILIKMWFLILLKVN